MDTITYSQFKALHAKIRQNGLAGNGSIEITVRCNLRCAHCYVAVPEWQDRRQELTYEEITRIFDEIAEEGCLFLLLTGGEPLVRRDFADIYTCAKQKGFFITVNTNATLVTERIADLLAEWPPYHVEVTLFGAVRETYERVTGIPGSYDRCLKGIHLLHDRGVRLLLKTVAMTLNVDEVRQMAGIAEAFGVDFKVDSVINPQANGNRLPLRLRLPAEQAAAIDVADPKREKGWREFGERYQEPITSDELYNCGAGVNSFHIDPYGHLQLCMVSRYPSYDLRRGSFREGWREFLRNARAAKRTECSLCVDCDLRGICETCPGTAEMEHGNKQAPVDYYCQLAHARANKVGLLARHRPHGPCPGGPESAEFASSPVRRSGGLIDLRFLDSLTPAHPGCRTCH